MDSFQLRYALLKTLPIFTVVCASDQLELLGKHNEFAIIVNNEPSTENGMHWISFYKNSQSDVIEFFDSYAMDIVFYPPSILKFCRAQAKHIRFSKIQIQSNLSNYCGHYCLWFLIHRYFSDSFEQVVKNFSEHNLNENDTIVKDFVDQHFKFPEFSNCKARCQEYCENHGLDFTNVCVQISSHCKRLSHNQLKHTLK